MHASDANPKFAEPPDPQPWLQLLKLIMTEEPNKTTGASGPSHEANEGSWTKLPDELLIAIFKRANALNRAKLICKAYAASIRRSVTRATPRSLSPGSDLPQPLLAAIGLPLKNEYLRQLADFEALNELDLTAVPKSASPFSSLRSEDIADDSTPSTSPGSPGPHPAKSPSPQPAAANTDDPLASLPVLPKLRRLTLPTTRLSSAAVERLKTLTAVSSLSFAATDGASMTEDTLAALQSLPLRSLQISTIGAESALQLLEQIASISSIESLVLPDGLPLRAAELPPQGWMTRLRSLTLGLSGNSYKQWGKQRQELFRALVPHLGGLKQLDMDIGNLKLGECIYDSFTDPKARLTLRTGCPNLSFTSGRPLPNLVALHVTSSYCLSQSTHFLKVQALERLEVGFPLRCKDLESLQGMSSLQHLTLIGGFTFSQPERATILAKLTALRRLSIEFSYIYGCYQQLPRILEAIAQLRCLADLYLIVDTPYLEKLTARQLAKISAKLHIQIGCDNRHRSAPLQDLAALEGLRNLRTLRILWSAGLAEEAWESISRLSGVLHLTIFAPLPEWAMWYFYRLDSLQRLTLSNAHGDVPEECLRMLAFLLQSGRVQWCVNFECPVWHMSFLFPTSACW